jgi:ribosomal protein S18 acetylase RimI-like enzyme
MQALEDNMSNKFAYLPKRSGEMTVTENAITVINTHYSSDIFNIICKTKTHHIIQLQQAISIFKNENLPFAWWTGLKDEPHDLGVYLETLQLRQTETELGMAVLLSELKPKEKYHNLEIQYVNNESLLKDFVKVLTELVPTDKTAIEKFYFATQKYILHKASALKIFIGYLNNKPIATAALFNDSGVAGIWDIMTLPETRFKGIGTDMTLHALNEGKKLGLSVGVLTASDEGQFVYKKLGFESLQSFFIYN